MDHTKSLKMPVHYAWTCVTADTDTTYMFGL